MKKITILLKDNSLFFKYRTNKPVNANLLNTSVISNNELVFSDEYIKENDNIFGLFINDLVKLRNINEIIVANNEMAELIFDSLKYLDKIECFTILQNENLSYKLCEMFINIKNLKKINCYGISEYMIEMLDRNGILVESRNEVLFSSNFMTENKLSSFSSIYYKNNIKINAVLTNEDIEDIKIFFNINKYIKVIHFDSYSFSALKIIIDILKCSKIKNILIEIHDDIDSNNDIMRLRNLNKELKSSKIKISLVYSKDYLEKNYSQQIIFTTLKICAMIVGSIIVVVLGYIVYNNYQSKLKVNNINNNIKILLENDNINAIEPNTGNQVSYMKLLEINPDIVGWLTVKDTRVDYPVVKTKDNSYYLRHNLYQEDDFNGWIFMHYRNDAVDLDDNTIIFGHNRFTSDVMFGSLQKLRKQSWFDENIERQYITYNTLTEAHTWKIFSVYSIKVTSDYILNTFPLEENKQEFIDLISKRSQLQFTNVEVTTKDKILTLSTCLDNDKRLVIHAVLLDDEKDTESE